MMRRIALISAFSLAGQILLSSVPSSPLLSINSIEPDKASGSAIVVSTFPTELTVDGLMSLYNGNFPLQMGAFSNMANADALRKRLEAMLNISVNIVYEDGLYKVRLNEFAEGQTFYYYIPVSFPDDSPAAKKAEHKKKPVTDVLTAVTKNEESQPEPPALTPDVETTINTPDTSIIKTQAADTVPETGALKKRRGIEKFLFQTGSSPWLTKRNYFGKSVALVNALIFTILMSVGTMIILLIIILLNRNRMEKEAKLRQYLLEQYQSLIVDYLFGETTADKFRPIASDIYRRQVLIDQMIDVSINLKGDAGAKLKKLYHDLSLDHDSIMRAHSKRWHIKIKGFRELAFMNIRDVNSEMYKALNSRNEILRMEAQIALVRLSEEDPFEFLSRMKRPFSLWEQISLHELLVQHEIPVPEFKRWLTSENITVVMFALRMIREFKQKDAEPEIMKVLLHRDNRVSQLAVQVAGDLDMRTTLDTMKRMYKYQDYNLCLEIIRSMGKMPELAMMGFLKLVLDKEDDVQLQIEATKAIENMGEEGVKALVKLMKSEYKNYSIIVRHVLDRRIY